MVSNCDMLKQTDLIWTLSIDLSFSQTQRFENWIFFRLQAGYRKGERKCF